MLTKQHRKIHNMYSVYEIEGAIFIDKLGPKDLKFENHKYFKKLDRAAICAHNWAISIHQNNIDFIKSRIETLREKT